jgi:phage-related protein
VSAVASLNGEVIDKFCIGLKLEEAMFVLHCFQKKSKHGIATPKEDMEIIWARLKVAELLAKELRDGKAHR